MKQHLSRSHKVDKKAKLHPLQLKKFVEKCATKLASDQCYPASIQNEFFGYHITIDEAVSLYTVLENVVENLDHETFLPKFYSIIKENCDVLFKGISKHPTLLLGMELASQIMAHVVGIEIETTDIIQPKLTTLTDRERNALAYLSGYVCGTLYQRLRKATRDQKSNLDDSRKQYLALLLASKVDIDDAKLSHTKLLNTKNRGGLWCVNDDTTMIFHIAETLFVNTTANTGSRIDAEVMVNSLLADPIILSRWSNVARSAELEICKEFQTNLLEHMLTLFLRVRAFSYAKDIKQAHKRVQRNHVRSL